MMGATYDDWKCTPPPEEEEQEMPEDEDSAPAAHPTFEQDFRRWHGRAPTGGHQHWCHEWDGLAIDDTCREFEACICFKEEPDVAF